MRRDDVDLFLIPDNQMEMHNKLVNWAMWVRPGYGSAVHPMWRNARSNGRQWHLPEIRPTCDTLAAHLMEKQVCALPNKHRICIKWYYVTQESEMKARRILGLTRDGLHQMVIDARSMLKNRC